MKKKKINGQASISAAHLPQIFHTWADIAMIVFAALLSISREREHLEENTFGRLSTVSTLHHPMFPPFALATFFNRKIKSFAREEEKAKKIQHLNQDKWRTVRCSTSFNFFVGWRKGRAGAPSDWGCRSEVTQYLLGPPKTARESL